MIRFAVPLFAIAAAVWLSIASAVAFEISEETHANYQAYLKEIGGAKRGAFAVSPDGMYSWYIYCEEISCIPTGIGQQALEKCQTLAGRECALMATDRTVRIPFTVYAPSTALSPTDDILKYVLDAERLKTLTIGNTMKGDYPNNETWIEYYDPNGEIRGRDDEHGSYTARYSFKGNSICFDYPGDDSDWCGEISMRGNSIDYIHDGNLVTFIRNTTLIQGNPSGL